MPRSWCLLSFSERGLFVVHAPCAEGGERSVSSRFIMRLVGILLLAKPLGQKVGDAFVIVFVVGTLDGRREVTSANV